jgi:hypothetical protein
MNPHRHKYWRRIVTKVGDCIAYIYRGEEGFLLVNRLLVDNSDRDHRCPQRRGDRLGNWSALAWAMPDLVKDTTARTWEGFQPALVVCIRATRCTLGDACARSSNMEGIDPARG